MFFRNPLNENLYEYEKRIFTLKRQLGLIQIIDDTEAKLTPREELLGLRQRTTQNQGPVDLDELIKHQQNIQEKIADDMLILTQNLKGQTELANKIIKKDTEVSVSKFFDS